MTDIGSTSSMTPVIMWDPVMGASKYELELDHWNGTTLRRLEPDDAT